MRLRDVLILILIVAAGSVGLTYWYVSARAPAPGADGGAPPKGAAPLLIATAKPVLRSFATAAPWIGTVKSQTSVDLIARVDGSVGTIEAEDQAPVEAGALLMQLAGPEVETREAGLQAEVDSLKSQIALADQTVERLQRSIEEKLATRDQLAGAQQSRIGLADRLNGARLALESAQKLARIEAPVAGIFTGRRVSTGQAVRAGDVLGRIIDPARLRVAASFFPPAGATVQGRQASVRLSASESVSGVVTSVLPESGSSGATQVWIEGPEIDGALRPGQTVSGEIALEAAAAALAVPVSAVVYDENERPYVFVQQGATYERRSVELGLAQGGTVQVTSGLEADDLVVTTGAYELFYREFTQQFQVED